MGEWRFSRALTFLRRPIPGADETSRRKSRAQCTEPLNVASLVWVLAALLEGRERKAGLRELTNPCLR